MIKIRLIYFAILYIILVPLLLQKKIDKLKPISLVFLAVLIILALDILIESPFFRNYYENNPGDTPFEV